MDSVTMEVGRRLRLCLASTSESAYAVVDDVVEGHLHVGLPPSLRRPRSGETVTVEWGTPRGWYALACRFAGFARPGTWRLLPTGGVDVLQRRGYVRVGVALPLTLTNHPFDPSLRQLVRGTTLDIGEGGTRVACPVRSGITDGARVLIGLQSESFTLEVFGNVVRVVENPRRDEVAICFDQPVPRAADLRRTVLRWQQRERLLRAS